MIYFVRHGESEENAYLKRGGVRVFEEHYNTPLTETGKKQAAEAAKRLKGVNIDVIVTSGLERAIQTGEVINRYHRVPMVVMEDLNEREDRRRSVGSGNDGWHNSFEFGREADPEIERLEDFRDRVVRAIEEIRNKYGAEDVLIVAHGGVSHVFRQYFLGEPWEGNIRKVFLDNAEVEEFDFGGRK